MNVGNVIVGTVIIVVGIVVVILRRFVFLLLRTAASVLFGDHAEMAFGSRSGPWSMVVVGVGAVLLGANLLLRTMLGI